MDTRSTGTKLPKVRRLSISPGKRLTNGAIILALVDFDLRKNSLSSDVIFGCGFQIILIICHGFLSPAQKQKSLSVEKESNSHKGAVTP